MPLYDFKCPSCGKTDEMLVGINQPPPVCCDEFMVRLYSVDRMKIKDGAPLFVSRMEDIHKAQEQRGERLRMIYPWEVVH